MENNYVSAREEAKRIAKSLGHKLGAFQPAGYTGMRVSQCKKCHKMVSVDSNRKNNFIWTPSGKCITDQCTKT